ncbi:MAG: ACP S-malonyltransferase [Patescibacteria group bacterium]|nr:ACP S-malonyltransferase [Patescibacteria group bacterium]
MRALVFPGQGTQFVGMGEAEYRAGGEFSRLCDQANQILGRDLTSIMFNGPADLLNQTVNTQPAIFLYCCGLLNEMAATPSNCLLSGHSIGEYVAYYFSGAISFEDCLTVVGKRAEGMQRASRINPGTMAAIIGLDSKLIDALCFRIAVSVGPVYIACFNSPDQTVISGCRKAVEEVLREAEEAGARRAEVIPVSGAFHTPLMKPAEVLLKQALDAIAMTNPGVPVFANVDGSQVISCERIHPNLMLQLTSPVKWVTVVERMCEAGADEFIEVGPGKVLRGLIRRIVPGMRVTNISDFAQARSFRDAAT